MGVNEKQDKTRNIIFQQQTRKTGKHRKKQGTKHQKTLEKRRKKSRKITKKKKDFDKISENAENGKEILTGFHKMLKTETRTKTRSSLTSQYDDLRAKTRTQCSPTQELEVGPQSGPYSLVDTKTERNGQTCHMSPVTSAKSHSHKPSPCQLPHYAQ